MADDLMHTSDIADLGREHKESAWFKGSVATLATVTDSTLTLLGHAGAATFGGLSEDQLWAWLTDLNILDNEKIKTIELLGCDVNGRPTPVYPGFGSRFATIVKKYFAVKSLPSGVSATTFLTPVDSEHFLYIAFTATKTEFSYKMQRETIWSNEPNGQKRRDKLAQWLSSKGYAYQWIKKGDVRAFLETVKPEEVKAEAEPLLLRS